MKWEEVRLGDVLELKYGKDHKKLSKGNIPVYGTGGIMRYVDTYLYDKESILIPRKGTLTNIFFIKNNNPFWTVDTIFWSKINTDLVFGQFLFYYLHIIDFSNFNEGSTIPSLTTKTLNKMKVKYPDLKTQKKIAKILSNYDDLIENNLKQIKLLEEKARLTYEEWFLRFRVDGVELEIDSESGLPFGWEEKKIGNLCHISSSKRIFSSDYVDDGIPFYRGKEISLKSKNQSINDEYFISKQRFEEIDKKFGSPKKNDILITAVGTLGSIYLVKKSDGQFYFKDGNLIWLQKFLKNDFYYIFYLLKSKEFQGVLQNIAIGSSQKALTIKALNNVKVKYPIRSMIDDFNLIVEPLLAQIENLNQQNQNLKEARDILLPRLMTGVIEP